MQKKIYITALILFLIALSLIIFLTNNQNPVNSENEVSGKVQEQATETPPTNENQYNEVQKAPNTEQRIGVDSADVSKLPLESFLIKSGSEKLPVPNVDTQNNNLAENKLDTTDMTSHATEVPTEAKAPEAATSSNIVEPPASPVVTESAPAENIATPTSPTPVTTPTEPVNTAPAAPTTPTVTSPEPSVENTEVQVEPEKVEKAKVLITSSRLDAKGQNPTITASRLEMTGDIITLRLEANKPISAKTYILPDPERVVLDLNGTWAVSTPKVTSNRMLKSIRTGEQASGTRLVFDMLVKAKNSSVKKINDNTIELIIK